MNEKKNIDRLFQERFKDFEAVPDAKIWNNIHDALHQKKSKKIIPLWWKLSGIAAGFVLAFLAIHPIWNAADSETKMVIAPTEIENNSSNPSNTPTETGVAFEKDNFTKKEVEKNSETSFGNTIQNKSVITNSNSNKNLKINQKFFQTNAAVSLIKKNSRLNSTLIKTEKVASNSINEEKNQAETRIEAFNNEKNIVSTKYTFANKNKIQEEQDSIAVVLASAPNPLEELLRKKNENENRLADAPLNRWNVSTNVAPVFFNSASNGSPIEAQFEGNNKTYDTNLSVGVGVQYAVNKKLSVRTGVNKVTLGYETNDVVFFGGINSSGVSNLASSNATSNIEVISANNISALRPFEENINNAERGVLNQKMGYYEVPLELSYALVNRKFGIHVIGGLSTLFLNENSVAVQSENTMVSLGKANNLNEIHFSGNAGIGFRYELWKNFEARFEPTLKYQFNTFNRDAGNFKPYFVGLYSGVSFRF